MVTQTVDIESTITNPNGNFNGCVKSGNCVTLSVGCGSISTNQSVANIPIGYRPSAERYIRLGGMATKNGSTWEPIAVTVTPQGLVVPYMLTADTYSVVRIGLTYII